MAIAFDSANSASFQGVASPSFTLTVVDGTNTCVLVAAAWRNTGGPGTVSSVTVTGGTGAAQVVAISDTFDNNKRIEIWKVVGVTAGSKTVQVNFSASQEGGVISAICCTGVNQSTPVANSNSAQGQSTTPSVTVTTASDQFLVDAAHAGGSGNTLAVGANQTQQYNTDDPFFDEAHAGSTQSGADGGIMSWTSLSDTWLIAAVSLQPEAVATTGNIAWITA